MKILCTGDWQARLSNLDICELVLQQCVQTIKDRQVDWFLHLGDWKDSFAMVDVRVTNFLIHAVKTIKQYCPIVTLLGNHDKAGQSDDLPSCFPVLQSAGATVYESPAVHDFGDVWSDRGQTMKAYMVPFIRDPKALLKAYQAKPKDAKLLFFHGAMNGCRWDVSRTNSEGVTAREMRASEYTLCIGGHVHLPQKVGVLHYVGSPFPCDWGEVNQKKQLLLIEFGNPYPISIETIPAEVPLYWDPDLPGFDPFHAVNNPCHIRIRVPYESQKQMAAEHQRYQEEYPKAYIHIVPQFQDKTGVDWEQAAPKSDEDLIRQFLQQNPLTKEVEPAVGYLTNRLASTGMSDIFSVQGLKLKRCTAENILCFEKAEMDLTRLGLTLVTARNLHPSGRVTSNGGGKTTFLSLPLIALTGISPKGQEHNRLVRRGEKTGNLTLEFDLPDGRECLIVRTRPSGLRFRIGDVDADMSDSKATQKLIERTTGLTWDVMLNSLYISQREVGTALTGTQKERQELFSRLLGLERFLKALELVRKDITRIDRTARELITEIELCKANIQTYSKILQTSKPEQYISKKEFFAQKLDLEEKIQHNTDEVTKCTKLSDQYDKWLTKNFSDRNVLQDKVSKYAAEKKYLNERVANTEQVKGTCPLCGSHVDARNLQKHRAEMEKRIRTLDMLIATIEKDITEGHEIIEQQGAKLRFFESQLVNRRLDAERFKQQLSALIERRKMSRHSEEIDTSNQDRLDQEKQRLEYHRAHAHQLADHLEFLNACCRVVARDGLPAFLCAAVCPKLNQAASEFSEYFSEGEIMVEFNVCEGSIDVAIQNPDGGETVEDQSAGEMRIAGLIAALSFRSVLVPYNLLILDEPSESLDSENARAFAQGISKVADRFGSVLLTTHNPYVLAELNPDYHLEIVKENGISTVHEVNSV